jgi:hypothetical protein
MKNNKGSKFMKKSFASENNQCYIRGNTPATPLAPLYEGMTRTNGRFFIFVSSEGWCA